MLLGHYGVALAAKSAAPRYLRTTRAKDRVGKWGLWTMVVVLLAIFFSGFVSPPPADGRSVAMGALGLWLFVPWGYWVDRHREAVLRAEG